MLFMGISTWDPENRDKLLDHFKTSQIPDGLKIIHHWVDLNGGRYIVLYEAENEEAFAAFNLPWSDICYVDSFPVMEVGKFMTLLSTYNK